MEPVKRREASYCLFSPKMAYSLTMTSFKIVFVLFLALASAASARTEVDEEGTSQGEKEARKYFRKGPSTAFEKVVSASSDADHYLALHLGGYMSGDAYQWGGTPHVSNPGRLMAGLTYKIDSWSTLADWAVRADFIGYELPEGRTVQIALLPLLMFPDSKSQFPLYFGLGVGPGIFFSQLNAESFLALDYQIIGGARLFNLVGTAGFFLEAGVKNHLFLLSDGQLNGSFVTVGTVFVF